MFLAMKGRTTAKNQPRRTQQDRRRQLLDIARGFFAGVGFAETTLEQIAEEAGIRKASLYYYFRTKEAFYCAVLDEIVTDLTRLIQETSRESSGFEERLDRMGRVIVDYFGSRREAASLLMQEMMGGGRYAGGPGAASIETTLRATVSFLEAGMAQGTFAPQDPAQLALSIIGLHLFYFAAPGTSTHCAGKDIFLADTIETRRHELVRHVRALCLPAT